MLKDEIVRYLAEKATRPLRMRELARALRITRKQHGVFRALLRELASEERIYYLKGRGYVSRGLPDNPQAEMEDLVLRAGLSEEFPDEVEVEAHTAASHPIENEIGRRVDLREMVVFTIDPADAKDFDDAVSIQCHQDSGWTVGIHIADVSHYVRDDTRLDAEAWERGTSVYLVDRVIPMLPEALSNSACSLWPDEERLAFSCFVRLDAEGHTQGADFTDTVIRSRVRLNYEQAQQIIDAGEDADAVAGPEVTAALCEMARVAQLLTRKRRERGSIDFDLPEPIVELDEEGFPVAVHERLRLASHRMIEEFMILANEAVAQYAGNLGLPFIYRVHEEPDPKQMEEFRQFIKSLGYSLPKSAQTSPIMLSELLQRVEGKRAESLINKVLLRHMQQAHYGVDNVGHFGLASRSYCHFTSPIRRYPDLVVHRLLRRYRQEVPTGSALEHLEGWLKATAEQASEKERAAMETERDSIKLKQIAFMEQHIGDVFPGIISGVTGFGLFVELEELLVDGLIHVSDLGDDYYLYEEGRYRLVGERTGDQFRLGDRIVVQVVRADRALRQLDFIPAPDDGPGAANPET